MPVSVLPDPDTLDRLLRRLGRGVRVPPVGATPRVSRRTLPPPPAPPAAPRLPPLEGRPGAWFVRGPDGAEIPVDPTDPDGLRAVAHLLLERA